MRNELNAMNRTTLIASLSSLLNCKKEYIELYALTKLLPRNYSIDDIDLEEFFFVRLV